jgi:hypothetical protein
MAVSQAEFTRAQGYYTDLKIIESNADNEVTVVRATIRGINGGKNVFFRGRQVDYQLLVDVNDLRGGLPTGWIVVPNASHVKHVNIWPAGETCPLTHRRLPRICWGSASADWDSRAVRDRTLSAYLEMASRVLGSANLESPAR